MTLQEKLKALNLSEDDIQEINSLVDGVINKKVQDKDAELETLKGDFEKKLEESNSKLEEYKSKEIDAIKTKIAKEVFGNNFEKGMKYSNFPNDFDFSDEDAVKAHLQEINDDLFSSNENDPENTTRKVGGTTIVPKTEEDVKNEQILEAALSEE